MTEPLPAGVASVPEGRHCAREGCARRKKDDGYCSRLCVEIDRRLTRTRMLISEKGISPTAAALWAAAVSLSDQLSEVDRLEALVKSAEGSQPAGVLP
jgi:hypothetical protein